MTTSAAAPADEDDRTRLSCCSQRVAYSFLRLPMAAYDFVIRPARNTVYRDALGMPIATQAALVAACKSLDFLLGFFIGSVSDRTRTRWGRRKPFIVLFGPLCIVASLMFANPPSGLGREKRPLLPDQTYCEAFVHNESSTNISHCPALEQCLQNSVQQGWLPLALRQTNSTDSYFEDERDSSSFGLNAYFAIFYFLYYAFGVTSVLIPYDALGMELTSDYVERVRLFGTRTAFQFGGMLTQVVLAGVANSFMADNIPRQVSLQAWIISVIMVVALLVLMRFIGERPVKATQVDLPIVPVTRRMLNNKPYMLYLLFRVPMTLASLLPAAVIGDYIKYCIKEEKWNGLYILAVGTVLISIFCALPAFVKLTPRYGKRNVLVAACLVESFVFICCYFVDPPKMKGALLYILSFCVGIGMAAASSVPDAVLADIIDYDELCTGDRREGMYTVVETNLQQFIEIIGGVLPGVVAGAYGFETNGGCSCGCGVECDVNFARWDCPDDLGYACSDSMDASLLLADSHRKAPCTHQNNSVQRTFRFFCIGLPGLMYLFAAVPAYMMAIDRDIHASILDQIKARNADSSFTATDPLTGKRVVLPKNSPEELRAHHFSDGERAWALSHGGFQGLRTIVWARFALWLSIAAGLVAAMGASNGNLTLVTFGCLALAAVFVLLPWEAARLKVLRSLKGDECRRILLPETTAPVNIVTEMSHA